VVEDVDVSWGEGSTFSRLESACSVWSVSRARLVGSDEVSILLNVDEDVLVYLASGMHSL
jgi:hypothetical protein